MSTRLEESLGRDIDRIKQQLLDMSGLAERAFHDCIEALTGGNRQRAARMVSWYGSRAVAGLRYLAALRRQLA